MSAETKDLIGTLLLLLAVAVGLFLIVDTTDIRVTADQGNGCAFWSHTDNRFFLSGVETVTREGLDCPNKTATRIA